MTMAFSFVKLLYGEAMTGSTDQSEWRESPGWKHLCTRTKPTTGWQSQNWVEPHSLANLLDARYIVAVGKGGE